MKKDYMRGIISNFIIWMLKLTSVQLLQKNMIHWDNISKKSLQRALLRQSLQCFVRTSITFKLSSGLSKVTKKLEVKSPGGRLLG